MRFTANVHLMQQVLACGGQVASGAGDTLGLLLSMSTGQDGSKSDRRLLTIETYPRECFGDLGDTDAAAKMNAWVSGHQRSPGAPPSLYAAVGSRVFNSWANLTFGGTITSLAVMNE
jgi:hypothetical protein